MGFFFYNRYAHYIKKNKVLCGNYDSLRFVAEYSIEKFRKIKSYNDTKNEEALKKKQIIKFGFVTYSSAIWNVDQLYRLLRENERFEADIIIAHRPVEKKFTEKEYNDTLNYFRSMGYSTKEASEVEGKNYDIIFFLDPGELLERKVYLFQLPLKTIVLHTSYSFMLAGNTEKIGAWMYHLVYKYYTDSMFYKIQVDNYKFSTNNTEFLGFPKMDQYYLANFKKRTNKLIIIYAPHHSVDYKEYKSATFAENYLAMLKFAQKYSRETYWIYKPHPRLRDSSVLAGIFSDVKEYDQYEKQWDSLQNADVVTTGDYYPVFKESDCMITDSVSFLAEYQFTHKPLLLLKSGSEEYNDFGKSILKILYTCDGNDEQQIEKFIINCINGEDDMFNQRKAFFDNNLDYMQNGETANTKIYNEIMHLIKK